MTPRYSAHCVSGVVNVEVGPLVGTLSFSLESQNLRQKVQSNPDIIKGDSRTQYYLSFRSCDNCRRLPEPKHQQYSMK
jgi:hypothetical protein